MHFDTFLFDLDGTLIDSLPDLATALNRLRGELSLPPLTAAEVRGMVGDGARLLVQRALPAECFGHERLVRFLQLYAEALLDATAPFPEMVTLLDRLWQRGDGLAVVTNKPAGLTAPILAGLELTPYFGAVLGGDAGHAKKPAPDLLLAAMAQLGAVPERTLMIGDHHTDLRAGRAAGVATCFCGWGYGHDDGVVPDFRVATPGELRQLLGAAGD